jgi:hypothetical protein
MRRNGGSATSNGFGHPEQGAASPFAAGAGGTVHQSRHRRHSGPALVSRFSRAATSGCAAPGPVGGTARPLDARPPPGGWSSILSSCRWRSWCAGWDCRAGSGRLASLCWCWCIGAMIAIASRCISAAGKARSACCKCCRISHAGCSISDAATAACCAIWPANARTVALSVSNMLRCPGYGHGWQGLRCPTWKSIAAISGTCRCPITTLFMRFFRRLRCPACGSRPLSGDAPWGKTGQQQFSGAGCQRGGPNCGKRQVDDVFLRISASQDAVYNRCEMTPGRSHGQPGIGMRFAI